MLLGWNEELRTPPTLPACGSGGHSDDHDPRTYALSILQGQADWRAIARVKDSVDIPVIANGDITSNLDARTALRLSGAEGVMIGRGAQGRPWLLAEAAH